MRALQTTVCSAVAVLILTAGLRAAEAPVVAPAESQVSASAAAQTPGQAPSTGAASQPTQASAETQSVHIQVGRSIILNTQARLRRIVVSSPDVLDTTTVSPTQLVVTAKAPGSSSLVLWDESGNARIIDVYADVDITGLRESIRSAHPNEPVDIEAEQGRIVITGTVPSKGVEDDIVRLATQYSKNVVDSMSVPLPPRAKQVMLKVQFAEVDRTKLTQFGFNLLSTGAANTIGSASTQQFSAPSLGQGGIVTGKIGGTLPGSTSSFTVSNLLNLFVYRPDLNLGATIQLLASKNIIQILAEPNLMARSGEPAKFLAGGEFPFPVVQGGGTGTNNNAVTIVFKPFGVKLEFTATVMDDVIRLKIAPEVSTLDFANALVISGFTVPALTTRRAETEIELRDGQSFAMAGLLDRRTTLLLSRVPGIGDIPVLGALFRSKSFNRSNTELMVMVTPTIMDPVTDGKQVPPAPSMPIRTLEPEKFDRSLDNGLTGAEGANTKR